MQPFAGPVAILVDALSGSASECFAGGMQSLGRVRVFGQRSMGQALPALFARLPNGDVLIHAYGDFVTADGTRLEGRGVVPDEAVPLDRAELLAGRDRTLEAALAWIDSVAAANRTEPLTSLNDVLRWRVASVTLRTPTRASFQPHHTGISGRSEWSSAGCVWATFSTTTVHASAA